MLELKNIVKTFTVRSGVFSQGQELKAVNGVSLAVKKGSTLGIVGESGCGKSTVGRIIAGLLTPDSGEVLLAGKSVALGTGLVQMIFQDAASSLNPRHKIGTSIREPLDIRGGLSREEMDEKVLEIMQLVGLVKEQAGRYPHEFSGGQRQRIAVARALLCRPEVVVCDEPVSSLDASVQAQVLNLLKDLQENFALTYVFISHDLAVVGLMSDYVAVMYLGRIVEYAKKEDIFKEPAHPYTLALLCSRPGKLSVNFEFLKSRHSFSGNKVELKGDLPSPLNVPMGCALHPRCPFAMPVCKEILPDLLPAGSRGEHTVACHLYTKA